jgi:AbrB family looped-hinge helix DNA binding protein
MSGMERVTLSSKGQIAIPRAVRDALNLSAGTKLTIDLRGQEIVLSKEPGWRKLRGAAGGADLMTAFAEHRKVEREREDSGS